ncbi:DUF4333 domain-containing protein [Streptomyces sp. NPDC024017]|uniref:DUF4333 domain-containing protein n=1 Tax=Streptomyces sp. NPDC024017 TaxID=3154326 RepID=UPI0033C2526D
MRGPNGPNGASATADGSSGAARTRVLIADDQEMVRTGFRLILAPSPTWRPLARPPTAPRASNSLAQKPKAVICAGGLKARQGDSVACTVTAKDENKQDILVSVTKVDGSKVSYDFVPLAD